MKRYIKQLMLESKIKGTYTQSNSNMIAQYGDVVISIARNAKNDTTDNLVIKVQTNDELISMSGTVSDSNVKNCNFFTKLSPSKIMNFVDALSNVDGFSKNEYSESLQLLYGNEIVMSFNELKGELKYNANAIVHALCKEMIQNNDKYFKHEKLTFKYEMQSSDIE